MSKTSKFRLGVLVNPVAGLGGPAGLKGSDNPDTQDIAHERGVTEKSLSRMREVFDDLGGALERVSVVTASGLMGADACSAISSDSLTVVYDTPTKTCSTDTQSAALAIIGAGVDLLIFAGGDGTARDICTAVGQHQPVLGVPAGVKMHSGVFAVTPRAVASVIQSMLAGRLVAAHLAEVRDIDEEAFAHDRVKTRHFGELLIPDDQLLVQTVKCSGIPDDELMLEELSSFMVETLEDDTLYILGSGGTLRHLKEMAGIDDPTLLGVDVLYNGQLVAKDVYEEQLYELLDQYDDVKLVLSIIGGQGVVFGRGNQQISARILEKIGTSSIQFIATQSKIHALNGKPLLVDTGSDELDKSLAGYHKIICGYDDAVLYEVRYLS